MLSMQIAETRCAPFSGDLDAPYQKLDHELTRTRVSTTTVRTSPMTGWFPSSSPPIANSPQHFLVRIEILVQRQTLQLSPCSLKLSCL
jgi:hypothetical protein